MRCEAIGTGSHGTLAGVNFTQCERVFFPVVELRGTSMLTFLLWKSS